MTGVVAVTITITVTVRVTETGAIPVAGAGALTGTATAAVATAGAGAASATIAITKTEAATIKLAKAITKERTLDGPRLIKESVRRAPAAVQAKFRRDELGPRDFLGFASCGSQRKHGWAFFHRGKHAQSTRGRASQIQA